MLRHGTAVARAMRPRMQESWLPLLCSRGPAPSACRRLSSAAAAVSNASLAHAQASGGSDGSGWGKAAAAAIIASALTAGAYHSLRDVADSSPVLPLEKKQFVSKEDFSVPCPTVKLQGTVEIDSELTELLKDEGLPENRIILAVGPNGAGKTSLIRNCLSSADSPTLSVEPREYAALYRRAEPEPEQESRSYLLNLLTAALTPPEETIRCTAVSNTEELEEDPESALSVAQRLYQSLSAAVKATALAGQQPTLFIDNFCDLVALAESEEDRQILESLVCWLLALAKSQGRARVVLASSDPFILDRLSSAVTDEAIANELRAATTQITLGETYSSNAAAAMLHDLCRKYHFVLKEEDEEALIQTLGASCSGLSSALRALQVGCTLEQAISWALAGTMEAAKALLQLEQGLLIWELMNVLAQSASSNKSNLSAPRYVTVEEVLAAFKDKRQHSQVLDLLHDQRVQQLIYFYRRPTLEMVRAGAPAHLPHVGMSTATLRSFERLVKDDSVKREMWERRRK